MHKAHRQQQQELLLHFILGEAANFPAGLTGLQASLKEENENTVFDIFFTVSPLQDVF